MLHASTWRHNEVKVKALQMPSNKWGKTSDFKDNFNNAPSLLCLWDKVYILMHVNMLACAVASEGHKIIIDPLHRMWVFGVGMFNIVEFLIIPGHRVLEQFRSFHYFPAVTARTFRHKIFKLHCYFELVCMCAKDVCSILSSLIKYVFICLFVYSVVTC
jgi:hypothetical protein